MAEQASYDLLVAGGGPAGLAAAAQAAAAGLSVLLVDERVTLGGQIHKRMGPGFEVRDPSALGPDYVRGGALIDAAVASGAEIRLRTSVLALDGDAVVLATDGERAQTVTARVRLIAAGAYDRPVTFPGWTLPGVLTAGGAQTLVKTQRVLPGENILFAGSGPLALAFPAQLHGYGANVSLVLEAGPPPRAADVIGMGLAAPGNVGLLRDAIRYRSQLLRGRIPLRYRRIVVRAEGDGRVESVTHAAVDADWRVVAGTEETVAADTLCLGYGFVPSTELPRLAGCAFGFDENRGGACVSVDEWMRTSVPGVLAAGDGTGVEGSYVAADEGRLAAIGAAVELGRSTSAEAVVAAAPIRRRLARKRVFGRALRRMHRIGPGVFELAAPQTIVCRCEEVTRATLDEAIAGSGDVNVVKSLTRAGMGLCQGRNCQRQIAASVARHHGRSVSAIEAATPRLPARPVPLGAIAQAPADDPGRFQ
ncbi:NAD(P)/FAD-dependent oxidoreductase [Conexibacter sp. CPCC 206217]|uniref:FAD/NAD(P)-dependent oxidoreductase n=1 Tax=Conexibacter sp. CPCC 206217 TaxID=3064574 RepID=UPI002725A8D3|nr:FAD-dependent oxidoreductase [Conexibacter sp. CPCC 206217]MDO8209022.1 FAD-dependent oxidoreductase [Conexibacter sp. CPCC 206217]